MRSETFSVRDVLISLLREKGIRTGHWELSVDFILRGTRAANPNGLDSLPGLVALVSDLVLVERSEATPASIDASALDSAQ